VTTLTGGRNAFGSSSCERRRIDALRKPAPRIASRIKGGAAKPRFALQKKLESAAAAVA